MESVRLKQFCAVVESGSLTNAASVLGITLSGLSRSMKLLQQQLRTELFRPLGRGILITDDGRSVYQRSKAILLEIDQLAHRPKEQDLRLGCMEVFTLNFLGELMGDVETPFKLAVQTDPGNIESMILSNSIDLGLTYLPFPMNGVEHLAISDFSLGAFKLKGSFRDQNVEDMPFVVPASGFEMNPIGTRERDGWPESLWSRRVTIRVNQLATAIDFVCTGVGAVFMPAFVAKIHNKRVRQEFHLETIQLPVKKKLLQRKLFFVKRLGSQETKLQKQFAGAVRRCLRQELMD